MIFSGVDLSSVTLSSGSLPVLMAVALTLMWWLDDELGAQPDQDRPDEDTPGADRRQVDRTQVDRAQDDRTQDDRAQAGRARLAQTAATSTAAPGPGAPWAAAGVKRTTPLRSPSAASTATARPGSSGCGPIQLTVMPSGG